jgi:hypothetical protein
MEQRMEVTSIREGYLIKLFSVNSMKVPEEEWKPKQTRVEGGDVPV